MSQTASVVLLNGRVATPLAPSGYAEAVAVHPGGDIAAIGTDAEIHALIGASTRVLDLRGRLAIPSFSDAHVHAVGGGFERLNCDLSGLIARDDCLATIARHVAGLSAAGLPGDGWVLGGGWSMETFGAAGPLAADLDAVGAGRPAFLPNRDHHSAWVSSAALALAGVDRNTPDPVDGRIERDAQGVPTGTLHDGAMGLVGDLLPAPSAAELDEALLCAQDYLHSLGVTRWQDAAVGAVPELGIPDAFDVYRRAEASGALTASVVGALWWDRRRGIEQLPELLARRQAAGRGEGTTGDGHGSFRATSVKLMVDGVCETLTAAMTEPYLRTDLPPAAHEPHCGTFFLPPDELTAIVAAVDAAGFQAHFHALGDRAVTAALDALAALPDRVRTRSMRHHIAHLQFIRPSDMERFAEVGAVANFQALWAINDPQMVDLTLPLVGPERAAWQYRIGSLAARGVPIAFGSDWPVSSPDPIQQIHVAVNRRLSPAFGRVGTPETDEAFLPSEAVSVAQAVGAFTTGTAWVNGAEAETGVLTPGRRADIAVLSGDIFGMPAAEIGDTTVEVTVAGGRVVFGDE
jgi:predicted amidohydrolase YtcJ